MKTLKSVWLVLAIAMLSILAACGNDENQGSVSQTENVEPAKAGTTEVTIDNNGTKQVYTEAPKKAISLNQHVTEIMLALGLEDSMVGTAYLDDAIYPPLQEAYEKVSVLAEQYPTKEQVDRKSVV